MVDGPPPLPLPVPVPVPVPLPLVPLGKAVLQFLVGGEVDAVVVVTDAEDGRAGLSGRMEEDMLSWFSAPCCSLGVPSPVTR